MSTMMTAQEYEDLSETQYVIYSNVFETISYFSYSVNYTQEFCIKYCYALATEAACGCVDPSVFSYEILYLYYTNANMSIPIACDTSQQDVWNCIQNVNYLICYIYIYYS